jgi:hypothetical protein
MQVLGAGAELMHHRHAAQVFELALRHREAAAGEDFDALVPSVLMSPPSDSVTRPRAISRKQFRRRPPIVLFVLLYGSMPVPAMLPLNLARAGNEGQCHSYLGTSRVSPVSTLVKQLAPASA